jgi:3-oxoacyl-[acyl-carrier-protein] synthase I
MNNIFVVSDSVISPLGITSEENFSNIIKGQSGLKKIISKTDNSELWASCFDNEQNEFFSPFYNSSLLKTRFEKLLYYSAYNAAYKANIDLKSTSTIIIVATTKGNIELIGKAGATTSDLNLYNSAFKIGALLNNPNKPVVVSTACTSGITALITAKRLLLSGIYTNAIVCAADTVSDFVLAGFQALNALSNELCKPFDANRKGINIGEAGAAMVLSTNISDSKIILSGGAVTNDANHISGPSRTGEELALAISKAIAEAHITSFDIDYVSAHGTATDYNDEMESKAFGLSDLNNKPLNSLKAYYGHTLGVAGLLESIIAIHSMKNNVVVQSKGFENTGTSIPLNICKTNLNKEINHCIKTTAGFGGCNAAVVFSKI